MFRLNEQSGENVHENLGDLLDNLSAIDGNKLFEISRTIIKQHLKQ